MLVPDQVLAPLTTRAVVMVREAEAVLALARTPVAEPTLAMEVVLAQVRTRVAGQTQVAERALVLASAPVLDREPVRVIIVALPSTPAPQAL